MMYAKSFIACIKVGGKILRDSGSLVTLPWGTEYSILLKNTLSRRAQVKVSVDGQDATEGTKLILEPNSSLELERFIKNGNLSSGNRFRFIERTENIENHRGIKEDDGLVRVEFWAEKEVIDVPTVRRHYYDEYYPRPWYYPYTQYYPYQNPSITWANSASTTYTSTSGGLSGAQGIAGCQNQAQGSVGMTAYNMSEASVGEGILRSASLRSNDAGITVPGSKSDQEFRSTYGFDTESNSTVIVLQLRGEAGGKPVESPVTVDLKPVCPTCGAKNKSADKFCHECGTSLQLI